MGSFKEQLCEVMALESGLDPDGIIAARGLMSEGLLDSFALVAVISLVETRLGREVDPQDLTLENFDSVDAICAFVGRAHVG